MIISPLRWGTTNIGFRSDSLDWVVTKWNTRYIEPSVRDEGLPSSGGHKWKMRAKVMGRFITGRVTDIHRNWEASHQDIVIIFNTRCQDASLIVGEIATGHEIRVNGVVQTTTFRSGSGLARWVLRIPILCDRDDIITYSYNSTVGNTTAVDDGLEIADATNVEIGNLLTRRIRFTLFGANNTPAANETIQIGVFHHNAGVATEIPGDNVSPSNPAGGNWMRRDVSQIATTNAVGLLDIPYRGSLVVGTTVYVVVYRPNITPTESFAWTDVIR